MLRTSKCPGCEPRGRFVAIATVALTGSCNGIHWFPCFQSKKAHINVDEGWCKSFVTLPRRTVSAVAAQILRLDVTVSLPLPSNGLHYGNAALDWEFYQFQPTVL